MPPDAATRLGDPGAGSYAATARDLADWLMREGKVAREEMWRTFNCGVGFTVILPRDAVAAAAALLHKHGLASSVIGEVVPAQGDERVHIG